jgi:uncharacterized membrane protein YkoI
MGPSREFPPRVRPSSAKVRLAAAAAVALAGLLPAAATAADRTGAAPELGAIVPMERVVESARARQPGQLLAVELEREPSEGHGDWVYEVKILTAAGTVVKLVYDAHTAELLAEKAPTHAGENEKED